MLSLSGQLETTNVKLISSISPSAHCTGVAVMVSHDPPVEVSQSIATSTLQANGSDDGTEATLVVGGNVEMDGVGGGNDPVS
jgi:hypothetical protein